LLGVAEAGRHQLHAGQIDQQVLVQHITADPQ
jgi:hypothetical protein